MSETNDVLDQATTTVEVACAPVTGEKPYSWKILLYQYHGNCWLKVWGFDRDNDTPWKPEEALMALYPDTVISPDEKNAASKLRWGPPDSTGYWDTGVRWGAGYYAALIAKDGLGKYHVVVRTPVTTQ